MQQRHAVIANTPHHQFTPAQCKHPFCALEEKNKTPEGRKLLNELKVRR